MLIAGKASLASGNFLTDTTQIEGKCSDIDKTTEFEAIMDVVDAAASSFALREYDRWKKHWIHDENVFHAWNFSDGSCSVNIGWKAIDEKFSKYTGNYPIHRSDNKPPEVKRENITCQFIGENTAYVAWKQYTPSRDLSAFNVSHEFCRMKKINGQWKFIQIFVFWDYFSRIPSEQAER